MACGKWYIFALKFYTMNTEPKTYHTYSAVQDENGIYTLLKDGQKPPCAWLGPAPLGVSMGQMQIARPSCNTMCPFAVIEDIEKDGEVKPYYCVKCSSNHAELPLSEINKYGEKKPALITT